MSHEDWMFLVTHRGIWVRYIGRAHQVEMDSLRNSKLWMLLRGH